MTHRIVTGWLVAATVAGSGLVLSAHDYDQDTRVRARDAAREVRHVVRQAVRDVTREVRVAVRAAFRDVQDAVYWNLSDADVALAKADRRGETAVRKRESATLRRERIGIRDQARNTRAFQSVSPTDDPCAGRRNERPGHACEVRDNRLPAPVGPLTVDASPNGGIRVEGWDQPDVLVRAVIQAQADDDADARALMQRVQITAAGTRVAADGPERAKEGRASGWSVSFRIWAPRQTALALAARNGGITLQGLTGDVRFETRNGGVRLDAMGGHVVGSTRNGGVSVRLVGDRWNGDGLDVATTNGGVSLAVPAGYSAELDASTVNGGVRTDVPLTVQGRLDRRVRTTLGSGGPLLKIATTNGGVKIAQR